MSHKITNYLRQNSADCLKRSFESEASEKNYYIVIGQPLNWPDELNPPDPTLDVRTIDYRFLG